MPNLDVYGWSDFFKDAFDLFEKRGLEPARVALQHNHIYRLYSERGELDATTTGKMRHEAVTQSELPAVGDWVAMRFRAEEGKATIHHVLPRKSRFIRKAAGQRSEEQIVGANIDTIFLVTALNNDYNVRRIERYLAAAWESGAEPVIILSKADLCADVGEKVEEVQAVAYGVPIHVISSKANQGLEPLDSYFSAGRTVALLGSSGVGKSTLINRLVGSDVQKVKEVREHDDRGRHATTNRELILLPQGGLVLDTPGMRELHLWDAESGVQGVFEDIESLAESCRFRDCSHENEPGCAVREALSEGSLDEARLENYRKLQQEMEFLELKREFNASVVEKKRFKKMMQAVRKREESR
ncbi:MAG TPA: ribosome small subunit-dependent GTPase A [Blastocatellia bacterium]|nr:ribosome small subunit-dependent GTPase A [Blastocatellia bacterium]